MKVIVDISDEFLKEIEKSMSKYSYANRAEWIREACRRHMKYLQGEIFDPTPEFGERQEYEEYLKVRITSMYVEHGLPLKVIASRLNLSPQSVKSRLSEYKIPFRTPKRRYKDPV